MFIIAILYPNIYLRDQDTIRQRHLAGVHWEAPGLEAKGLFSLPAGNRRSSETTFSSYLKEICPTIGTNNIPGMTKNMLNYSYTNISY